MSSNIIRLYRILYPYPLLTPPALQKHSLQAKLTLDILLFFCTRKHSTVSKSGLLTYFAAPHPFESEIEVDVTFLRDGTPMAEISFEVTVYMRCKQGSFTDI